MALNIYLIYSAISHYLSISQSTDHNLKLKLGKNKLLQLLIATINFDVIHLPLCQGVGILFKVILEASKALTSFPADISVGAKFQALLVNVLTLRRDQKAGWSWKIFERGKKVEVQHLPMWKAKGFLRLEASKTSQELDSHVPDF